MDKVDVKFPKAAKEPAANLPKNAEERAVALVDLMERLAAHLDRETAAVQAHRRNELTALVRTKEPMVLVYEEVSRLLRIDREGMAGLPGALLGRLKAATHALAQAAADNGAVLARIVDGQKLLVDTVVASVNRGRQNSTPAYGPTAGGFRPTRGYAPPGYGPTSAATLNAKF